MAAIPWPAGMRAVAFGMLFLAVPRDRTSREPVTTSSTSWLSSASSVSARLSSSSVSLPPRASSAGAANVLAAGSRDTETIPQGQIGNDRDIHVTNERWYSDDLQMLVKTVNSDPRFGENSYEFTNVDRAEPDPTLFQIPGDYTVSEGTATFTVQKKE